MYGKLFASCFTGSMFGAGADVFAVWAYVIANCQDSTIELNPALLAAIIGADRAAIQLAIGYLCRPDPDSRNPAEDGRRLIHEGAFQYRVVSHAIYRRIHKEEERREYNRVKKREERARGADGQQRSAPVNKCQQSNLTSADLSASVSASEEAESEGRQGDAIAPEMIASAVLEGCRISGRDLRTALEDVARAELKAGRDPDKLRDELIAAYRQYEQAKPRLSFAKGAAKFFGDGDWRSPAGWPWKDGKQPQTADTGRYME